MLSGTRHRHVSQTALFLNLLGETDGHIRRDAAIDHIKDEYGIPFPALRRVDGRKHEVILVKQGAGLRGRS